MKFETKKEKPDTFAYLQDYEGKEEFLCLLLQAACLACERPIRFEDCAQYLKDIDGAYHISIEERNGKEIMFSASIRKLYTNVVLFNDETFKAITGKGKASLRAAFQEVNNNHFNRFEIGEGDFSYDHKYDVGS